MKKYTYKPLEFNDQSVDVYSNFLAGYYKRPDLFTFEYLKWQYAKNPMGKAVGYNAFFKDELIAHVVTIPMRAVIFDKEEKWLLLVNAITVPEYRKKGISVGLAEKVEQLGIDLGYAVIIGIANRNSTPSYIKGRGMEWSTTLDAHIGIGRPTLKKKTEVHCDFRVLWDKKSLDWRLKRPGSQYWRKRHQKRCKVYALSGKPGIKTLLGNFAPEEVGEHLPSKRRINKPLTLWIGKDPNIDWHRTLSFNLPGCLRPSPLNFLYKDLSGKNRSLIDKRIFFQAVDFDAF